MIYAKREFWLGRGGVVDRAIRTGGQFAVATLGVGLAAGGVGGEAAEVVNALAVDFVNLTGVFLGGGLVSLLTSLALPDGVGGQHRTEG